MDESVLIRLQVHVRFGVVVNTSPFSDRADHQREGRHDTPNSKLGLYSRLDKLPQRLKSSPDPVPVEVDDPDVLVRQQLV